MSLLLQYLVPRFDHSHGNFSPLVPGHNFSCSSLCLSSSSCPSAPLRRDWSVLQPQPHQWPYWTCSCMTLSLHWGAQTIPVALTVMTTGQRDRNPSLCSASSVSVSRVQSAFAAWANCWLLGNLLSSWTPRYLVWFLVCLGFFFKAAY